MLLKRKFVFQKRYKVTNIGTFPDTDVDQRRAIAGAVWCLNLETAVERWFPAGNPQGG
jgi:hypothetical protein